MKHFILSILACLAFAIPVAAQSTSEDGDTLHTASPAETLLPAMELVQSSAAQSSCYMLGISPFGYGYNTWKLHKGLNASLGMNLTFSPSKYMPSGVGFGQDATFLYVAPLTKRFSVAGGLYASNMNWGWYTRRNVGITGIAGYQLTERISLYAYGNKSLTPQNRFDYYTMPYFAPDKIGGMVNFKVGEAASFSVGVERISFGR